MKFFKPILCLLICLCFTNCAKAETVGAFHQFAIVNPSNTPNSQAYTLGNFNINWNASNLQLSVSNTEKMLWQNLANTGFIGAAIGNETITEQAGSFSIRDNIQNLTTHQSVQQIIATTDSVSILGTIYSADDSINYSLTFSLNAYNDLHFTLTTNHPNYNRLFLSYACNINEQFFGFGEQQSHFNHKGNRVPIIVQEQGVGRGDVYSNNPIENAIVNLVLGNAIGDDYTSYKVAPHYISSNINSLYLENYEYSEFDFTKTNQVQIELFASTMEGNIIYANSVYDVFKAYTNFCGRMKVLPDWITNGAIIGMQGGTQKFYSVWQKLNNAGVPITAFWLQDWVGQRTSAVGKQLWWNWELDNDHYPNWNAIYDTLQENNIQLMGYINPFIVRVNGEKPNFRRNQYAEARDNGYLALNHNGNIYQVQNTSFSSAILDLSNADAIAWTKDIIKDELLARGLRGWMADFAEALPFEVELHSGESPSTFHNKYPEVWEKLNKDAIQEVGLTDSIVFFSRAGYSQSPKHTTLFWQGDQIVGWGENDGLKSAVTGLLSAGLSGFTLNHSDIGGYTSIGVELLNVTFLKRSQELLNRWAEMAAFTPVFRTHEGLGPDKNYQVYQDDSTALHFAKQAKIFQAWFFYRKQLMQEAQEFGYPICRPMFVEFTNDVNTYNITYQQFMVGTELLVAPVLNPNTNQTSVYLPQGSWENLWTGEIITSTGQTYTVSNLMDKAAVFYKQGSIIGNTFKQNLINSGVY